MGFSTTHLLVGLTALTSFCSKTSLVHAAENAPSVTYADTKVTYQGSQIGSVEHFYTIKYGEDTSGANRFAPPIPFVPSPETIIDVSKPGPACPQLKMDMSPLFSQVDEISEDCLTVHIARPAGLDLNSDSKLPVVVWNPNGGVIRGTSIDPHIDPEKLLQLAVADGKPVIFIAIQHRLSIFGFARLPLLKDEKALNIGLRDHRLALEWIRDNIRNFGGDPERITHYGLSAGGTTISLQTLAFGGEKGVPFQQAWMMSGPPGTALNISSDATELHTIAVAERNGCVKMDDKKMIECLRALSMDTLIESAMEYSIENHPPNGLFTFIPSMDGDFLPDRQSVLMRQGKFAKGIRTIFGWTQDDGAMNVGPGHLIQTEDDMKAAITRFSSSLTPEQYHTLFTLYPASDFEEEKTNYDLTKSPDHPEISVHYFRVSRILRDILFTCSSIDYAYHMVKQTQKIDPSFDNVRLYALNQSMFSQLWAPAGMPYVKVSHGSDTHYIFNGLFPEGTVTAEDKKLSEQFTRSLVSFAYEGTPISKEIKGSQFEEWPVAYRNVGVESGERDAPAEVNVQVIGGPFGTGSVLLKETGEEKIEKEEEIVAELGFMDRVQQVFADATGFGAMDEMKVKERKRIMENEKLLQRCAYVNSLAETLDV